MTAARERLRAVGGCASTSHRHLHGANRMDFRAVHASSKGRTDGKEEGQEVLRHFVRRQPIWDSRRIPFAVYQEIHAWETQQFRSDRLFLSQ